MRTTIGFVALAALLAGQGAAQRSATTLAKSSTTPTVTGVSLPALEVRAGRTLQFSIVGSNLSGASALLTFVGTRQLTDPGLTLSIVSASSAKVAARIVAGPSARINSTYQLRLQVGRTQVTLPGNLEVLPAPVPSVAAVSPAAADLQPGGAVTVILQGSDLDLLTTATVKRNGAAVSGISAALKSGTSTSRPVTLTATANPGAPLGSTLQLAVTGSSPSPSSGVVGLQLSLTAPSVRVHEDDLFGNPVTQALQPANTSFVSCGPTAGLRRLMLAVGPYNSNVAVPRYEHAVTTVERASFLEQHSLDPTDALTPQDLGSLTQNLHPSPFAHTVSSVRLCVIHTATGGNWRVTDVSPSGGYADVTVEIVYPRMELRARAMPAHPILQIEALAVGIGWGHDITDWELPDIAFASPKYVAKLRFETSGGMLKINSVQFTQHAGNPSWSGRFLGPQSVKSAMEAHAKARMRQLGTEIEKAFASSAVRNAITAAVNARLGSMHSVSSVLALQHVSGDMWDVYHP